MDPIFACALLLLFLSFAAEPALSLQCYNCTAFQLTLQGAPPLTPEETKCLDPFNMEGIQKIDCDGSCYGQMSTVPGVSVQVTRGCSPSVECGCIPPKGPPGICRFCCDGELCNNVVIGETARAQEPPPVTVEGTRNCWKCEEAKSDGTDGSCASDEFSGKGATKVECNAQCVLFKGENNEGVESVYRDCDQSLGQLCQVPGAMCCTEELCNGDEESGDGDDDDDVQPIDCWKCTDKIGSVCSEGEFTEEAANISKTSCPTGKCVTLVSMLSENEKVFVRDCLLPLIGDGICEKDASDNILYQSFSDVECCSKDLCNGPDNGAPVATSSLAAIFLSTFYVLLSKALM